MASTFGTSSPIDLSVVVPAFNEERRIGRTLQRIVEYLNGRRRSFEVLVVDDGSSDRTAELAAELKDAGVVVVRQKRNLGKGAAVRAGVLASRGDWVLLTDADMSTPIEDLERLEAVSDRADLVLGSRALPGSEISRRQPRTRELMGKSFNVIIRALRLVPFRDTQCGFKLIRGQAARELLADLTVAGFAFDVELVYMALARGLRVEEVGVRWENSPHTKVRPIRDSARMLRDVLRLRLREWT